MMGHIDIYRAALRNLDYIRPADAALDERLYVERPGEDTADRVVRALELRPEAQRLLFGGIGSGKSTELARAQRRLALLQNAPTVVSADWASLTTSVELRPGALQAAAVAMLATKVPEDLRESALASVYGHGQSVPAGTRSLISLMEITTHETRWIGGPLSKPANPATGNFATQLKELTSTIDPKLRGVILFLDGFDRVKSDSNTMNVVERDCAILRQHRVGLVATAPHSLLLGGPASRFASALDGFDVLRDLDPEQKAHRIYLMNVLRARVPEAVMSPAASNDVIRLSAGILRDLLSIAARSVEEAWMAGAPHVDRDHAAKAGDRFASGLELGLSTEAVVALKALHETGKWPAPEMRNSLLVTRRVVDYQGPSGGESKLRVHPALISPLARIAA